MKNLKRIIVMVSFAFMGLALKSMPATRHITRVGAPDIAVAPEPISSILFVTGGTLLAGEVS